MDKFKFHIKVKKNITKVLIFNESDLIGEMHLAELEEDAKIFNGTIDNKYQNQKLKLYLLGKPATFEFCFNELFNISLETLEENKKNEQENFVIVNTPTDVMQVILTIPEILADVLKIPTTIILLDAAKSAFRLKLENMTFEEKIKHGIDPNAINFIRYIPMYTETLNPDLIKFLDNLKIKVTCYKILIGKELIFK
jgi:hypothetical protein